MYPNYVFNAFEFVKKGRFTKFTSLKRVKFWFKIPLPIKTTDNEGIVKIVLVYLGMFSGKFNIMW